MPREKNGDSKWGKRTEESIELVQELVLANVELDQICQILKLTEKTFKRRFATEWNTYKIKRLGRIAKTAYEKAEAGDNTMICFVMKTQGGWKENDRLELAGSGMTFNVNVTRHETKGKNSKS